MSYKKSRLRSASPSQCHPNVARFQWVVDDEPLDMQRLISVLPRLPRDDFERLTSEQDANPKRLKIQPVATTTATEEPRQPKQPSSPSSALAAPAAGLILLIAGIWGALWIIDDVNRDVSARRWTKVSGRVSVVEPVSSQRKTPMFRYRYLVGRKWLTGERVRFAGGQGEPTRLYRVGQKIDVYIDPTNPAISTLKPGVIPWVWAQLIASIVAIALGGVFLFSGGRRA